tara:strand:- start:13352 stop:14239 length:888 start_codon:yes stop_codon:yes gene_type:complete
MTTADRVLVRRFARAAEPLHSCSYYADEITQFDRVGYSGWWHAYFAYRSAPLGPASSAEVTEVFYNFAPRMVARAVPGCWDILNPRQTRTMHLELVEAALSRIFNEYNFIAPLDPLVDSLRTGLTGLNSEDRPLFGAWADESWPQSSLLGLWHASTLLREYRFDAHNLALRNAGISGLGSHLLMAADGRGTPQVIQKIRGWTQQEWDSEASLLHERGWLDSTMGYTELGRIERKLIESETDNGCLELCSALDKSTLTNALSVLEAIAQYLIEFDVVPGRWPPAHLGKLDPSTNQD